MGTANFEKVTFVLQANTLNVDLPRISRMMGHRSTKLKASQVQ